MNANRRFRTRAAWRTLLVVLFVSGCETAPVDPPASRGDPPAEASTAVPRIPFPPPPADPNPPLSTAPLASPNPRFAESVQQYETSGTTVWANGYEGELIAGLDGSEYIPYSDRAVEGVQDLLRTRGLYAGPVNGVLDPPTMQAIAEFQEATQTLRVSGIPTPRTRRMLRQGSHTI